MTELVRTFNLLN